MKRILPILLASFSLFALSSCMETLNSVAQAAGSAQMGGQRGGYGMAPRSSNYGGSPFGQQQAGYRSSGSRGGLGSILGGLGGGASSRGGHGGASQKSASLPPGFVNEVRGLDYKSDDLLREVRKFVQGKATGLSASPGFMNLLKATESLESSLDDYEKVVGKKRGVSEVGRVLNQALEASSAVKLRMQRLKSTPSQVISIHGQIERELKGHYRMLTQ